MIAKRWVSSCVLVTILAITLTIIVLWAWLNIATKSVSLLDELRMLPLYANANQVSLGEETTPNEARLLFQTSDPPNEVITFYEGALPNQGWGSIRTYFDARSGTGEFSKTMPQFADLEFTGFKPAVPFGAPWFRSKQYERNVFLHILCMAVDPSTRLNSSSTSSITTVELHLEQVIQK